MFLNRRQESGDRSQETVDHREFRILKVTLQGMDLGFGAKRQGEGRFSGKF